MRETIRMTTGVKNVLHLIGSDFYGGPEKQIIEHLKVLDKKQYSGHIASFLEGSNVSNEVLDVAEKSGIQNHSITMRTPLDYRAISQLKQLLTSLKIDLICAHGYKSAVLSWIVSKSLKIPAIAFSHGYTTENFKVAFYEWLERKALAKLDGVITVSYAQKRRLDDFNVKYKKCWVVHNATTVKTKSSEKNKKSRAEICKEFSLPESKKIAVIAGRLSPEKAHTILLDAVKILGDKLDDTVIFFCGDGPCREALETKVNDLGVSKICIFTGFRRDMDKFYEAMDYMILSSLTEGLPLVVLEAMANAKPVVSTSVGGVPEVIEDGVNGYLVKPNDAVSLANGIGRAISDFSQFETIGNNGYTLIEEKFSFAIHAEKIQNIYSEVLN